MSSFSVHLNRRLITLNNGRTMPMIGLGTWKLSADIVGSIVPAAVAVGYRHFDGAAVYENEDALGKALGPIFKQIPREEFFFTSKVWNTKHRYDQVLAACEQSLRDWGIGYFDLYLIHWPFSFAANPDGSSKLDPNGVAIDENIPIEETWLAMEKLVELGKAKSIGVSNFTIPKLKKLLQTARIRPAVNQIELHPYLPQPELLKYCHDNQIAVTAYSSLGAGKENPSLLNDPNVAKAASLEQKTTGQVLLEWGLDKGCAIIPRTSNPTRLSENFNLGHLTPETKQLLDSIVVRKRYGDPVALWKRDCFQSE